METVVIIDKIIIMEVEGVLVHKLEAVLVATATTTTTTTIPTTAATNNVEIFKAIQMEIKVADVNHNKPIQDGICNKTMVETTIVVVTEEVVDTMTEEAVVDTMATVVAGVDAVVDVAEVIATTLVFTVA